jgi:hypothetical protein
MGGHSITELIVAAVPTIAWTGAAIVAAKSLSPVEGRYRWKAASVAVLGAVAVSAGAGGVMLYISS